MPRLALIGLLLLTSCTTVPVSVGSIGLCVGVCRFDIKAPAVPQTAAQQVGSGLAALLAQQLMKKH